MQVRYRNEVLRHLAVDNTFHPTLWEQEVVRSYRRRLQSLQAARDFKDLKQVRCLDLRAEHGRNRSRSSIRLVHQARLLLAFDAVKTDEVTVMDIIDSDTREATP